MQHTALKLEGTDRPTGSPDAGSSTSTVPHSVRCFLALTAAATNPQFCRADIACLAVILNRFNREIGAAWPGVNRLAAEANLHRSNVIRAIQRLEDAGYLSVQRDGKGKSNRYRPTFIASSASATSTKRATSSANATEVVAPPRLELVAPARPEPAYRTSLRNLPKKSSPTEASLRRFDDFWNAYPRKTGSIPKARQSWSRQHLDAHADSIIAVVVDRTANDPQWSDPKFIPYPATFLNQQRWNDEWAPAKKKPSAADRFTGKTYEGSTDDELPSWAR